jgi:hypothetical protein
MDGQNGHRLSRRYLRAHPTISPAPLGRARSAAG